MCEIFLLICHIDKLITFLDHVELGNIHQKVKNFQHFWHIGTDLNDLCNIYQIVDLDNWAINYDAIYNINSFISKINKNPFINTWNAKHMY